MEKKYVSEEEFLTTGEVSRWIKASTGGLANDRWRCKGLPYLKIGGKVRYLKSDILKYLEDKKIRPSD
jgi:hypothetical protein